MQINTAKKEQEEEEEKRRICWAPLVYRGGYE
jgi:hypothetical protein